MYDQNNNDVTYFDSFGVEHVSKEINRTLSSASQNKIISTNIFRIQAYDSIMCGYFCIGFIDFMLQRKALAEYANVFSPNSFKKNDDDKLFYEQYLKMDDFNKTPNVYPNINAIPSNEQQFRLIKINEIKDYFLAKIRERELICKNVST